MDLTLQNTYLTQAGFQKIREKLAGLYIGRQESLSVCRDAGLDASKIEWNDQPFARWDSILSRAESESKVADLLRAAILNCGGNNDLQVFLEELRSGLLIQPLPVLEKSNKKNEAIFNLLLIHDNADGERVRKIRKQLYIFELNQDLHIDDFQNSISEGELKLKQIELLKNADIIMPVISVNFFSPKNEYLPLLASAIQSGIKVVPVLLETCLYSRIALLKDYITLPRLGKFISEYSNEESGYADVAIGVEQLLKNLNTN